MKIFLIIFVLFFPYKNTAQTLIYHPFPDSNASWCVEQFAGGGSCNFTNIIYRLDGDSMINGLLYQRMSHYEYTERRDCITNQLTFWLDNSLTYYIRQDSSLKKIRIINPYTHQDTIMYDFNLQIGDTINATNTYWGEQCFDCVVSSIDSILIGTGYRKRFNYQSMCPGFYPTDTSIVEGIGALHGLLSGPSCFEADSRLREFSKNNITLYNNNLHNYHYGGCQTFVNLEELTLKFQTRIYPNPFSEKAMLEIFGFTGSATQLKVYNLLGTLVRSESLLSSINQLERNELSTGIYFYRLTNENGKTGSGKFIID